MRDDYIIKQAEKLTNDYIKGSSPSKENNHSEAKYQYSPPFTLDSVLKMEDIQEDWLVDSIVLNHGITTVSGLPNHFKSFFVQMLVKSVASGEDFLGNFKTTQGSVLVIDREIPTIRLKKRWGSIGAGSELPIFFYSYSDPFKLDRKSDTERLEALVQDYNFKLIVIDTFNRSHSGKETNSYSEIAGVFEPLKRLLDKTSIILIHHSNKAGYKSEVPTPEELMGSTDFAAETDLLFTIRKKGSDILAVHNLKAKDSPLIEAFELRMVTSDEGILTLEYQGIFQPPASAKEAREIEILKFLGSGKKMKSQILAHMAERGEKEGTINNLLTQLRSRSVVGSESVGKEAQYFLLDLNREQEDERFPVFKSLDNGKQGNVLRSCRVCNSTKFWKRHDGGLVCSACHPPSSEDLVKERVEVEA